MHPDIRTRLLERQLLMGTLVTLLAVAADVMLLAIAARQIRDALR